MLPDNWLRGVKRSPQEFDDLVLRIVDSRPGLHYTAQMLSERLADFNGQIKPDVNRVLRSMKRLNKAGKVYMGHYSRGWFNYYWVRGRNG